MLGHPCCVLVNTRPARKFHSHSWCHNVGPWRCNLAALNRRAMRKSRYHGESG